MKSAILFFLLLVTSFKSKSQESPENYYQTKFIDQYGKVVEDWHIEKNVFTFNAGEYSEIVWTKATGKEVRFKIQKTTVEFDGNDECYKNYEVTAINTEFGYEELVVVRRYTTNGLLLMFFWDGVISFLQYELQAN